MRRAVILGLLVAIGAGGMAVAAQQAQQPQPLTIEKVKENLYVIVGGGGNTAAYIIAKGVVLVDTKLANYGQPILDKVKSVTDKPITHIINTHTHGDHVGSNEFFPAAVEIVAQENTAANMVKMPAFQDPAKKHGLADKTFKDTLTLLAGAESIDLYYFGRAHTNGDTFVVFRDAKVMHAGDAFARKGEGGVDPNNGGSGVAWADTITKAAQSIKDVTTVIPGHSTLMTWQDFVDFGEFNRLYVAHASASMKAGRTAEEAMKSFALPEKLKGYILGGGRGGAAGNFAVIYAELAKR